MSLNVLWIFLVLCLKRFQPSLQFKKCDFQEISILGKTWSQFRELFFEKNFNESYWRKVNDRIDVWIPNSNFIRIAKMLRSSSVQYTASKMKVCTPGHYKDSTQELHQPKLTDTLHHKSLPSANDVQIITLSPNSSIFSSLFYSIKLGTTDLFLNRNSKGYLTLSSYPMQFAFEKVGDSYRLVSRDYPNRKIGFVPVYKTAHFGRYSHALKLLLANETNYDEVLFALNSEEFFLPNNALTKLSLSLNESTVISVCPFCQVQPDGQFSTTLVLNDQIEERSIWSVIPGKIEANEGFMNARFSPPELTGKIRYEEIETDKIETYSGDQNFTRSFNTKMSNNFKLRYLNLQTLNVSTIFKTSAVEQLTQVAKLFSGSSTTCAKNLVKQILDCFYQTSEALTYTSTLSKNSEIEILSETVYQRYTAYKFEENTSYVMKAEILTQCDNNKCVKWTSVSNAIVKTLLKLTGIKGTDLYETDNGVLFQKRGIINVLNLKSIKISQRNFTETRKYCF